MGNPVLFRTKNQTFSNLIKDIVALNNLQFVYDSINKKLPKSCHTFFTLKTKQHRHNTHSMHLGYQPQFEFLV